MLKMMVFVIIAFSLAWTYSSEQTNGLINKRYSNQDAAGRVKDDQFSGRTELAEDEIQTFLKHPIIGIGVGRNMEQRYERTGEVIVSHNEITRMIAEHGALGILGLMILFFTPLVLYFNNKYNLYLLCFLAFWLLTINHAAMRLAAPAFIYSLSLLKVMRHEE
jgi:O-antigen ligase